VPIVALALIPGAVTTTHHGGPSSGAALALPERPETSSTASAWAMVIDFLAVGFGPAQIVVNLPDVALFIGLPMLVLAVRDGWGSIVTEIGHNVRFNPARMGLILRSPPKQE
jgi:hypothetical protein